MVRHSDRHTILTAFSRERGRVGLLLPASNTPRATAMRSMAMPMCRFECEINLLPGREIYNIRDMRRVGSLPPASPVKGALIMFAADFASSLLREPQADANLYDFLCRWTEDLAAATPTATANMHIHFLIALMQFMGIEPDWSTFHRGTVFDMVEGRFRASPPLHRRFLTPQESQAAFRLHRMNSRTAGKFVLNRAERNRILDVLLQYYHIHFPSLGGVSSVEVLRALFNF